MEWIETEKSGPAGGVRRQSPGMELVSYIQAKLNGARSTGTGDRSEAASKRPWTITRAACRLEGLLQSRSEPTRGLEDMPVEGIEERSAEVNNDGLGDFRLLADGEVFVLTREGASSRQ
jgi:hypothetical protein